MTFHFFSWISLMYLFLVVGEIVVFPGRSGDVILKPEDIQDDSILFLQGFQTNQNKLSDVHVAEILSSSLGGPIINPENKQIQTDPLDIFNIHQANLFFIIDSVGSELLQQFPDLKMFQRSLQKLSLEKTNYPQDSLATLTTILSGKSPSQHGITGKSWMSPQGEMFAYKANALPLVASVPDIFTQLSGGKSLIISGSADFQIASTLSVHQYLIDQNPSKNVLGVYWNSEKQKLESLYSENHRNFTQNRQEILTRFSNHLKNLQISYPISQLSKEKLAFIVEIEFLATFLDMLQDGEINQLTKDSIPDFFSLGFSSLKGLKEKYGENSTEFKEAFLILDIFIDKAIKELSFLYADHLAVEIVFLGIPAQERLRTKEFTKLQKDVLQILGKEVDKETFDKQFPIIYLKEPFHVQYICNQVEEEIQKYSVEIFCVDPSNSISRIMKSDRPVGASEDTQTYQIVIWASILLIIAVYLAIYAIYSMDIGADSLIYRLTTINLKKTN